MVVMKHSGRNYLHDLGDDLLHLFWSDSPNTVENDALVGSEKSFWANITLLLKISLTKILDRQRDSIGICQCSTGDLAENHIITIKWCDDKGRPAFGCAEVRIG